MLINTVGPANERAFGGKKQFIMKHFIIYFKRNGIEYTQGAEGVTDLTNCIREMVADDCEKITIIKKSK